MNFKSIFCFFFLCASTLLANEKTQPRIQIALLLDASGSMNGLISQAQSKLWALVNELAIAKKQGQTPRLEVALFMYGHSSLTSSEGYLRCLQTLTSDLDAVSEALFQITTNGGEEYCGSAIQAATGLNWSENPSDYKAIFIAGNEPFNQGPVDFRNACRDAIAKGIVVNTIFCGSEEEGIRTHWKTGATLADGRFMSLNHQAILVSATTPQDADILRLGDQLNQTFLAYGPSGQAAKERQKKQDANAEKLSEEVAVTRVVAKASPAYRTDSWDLVSATESGAVELALIDEDALPKPLLGKSEAEQKTILKDLAQKRGEIKEKIAALKKERAQYLAKKKTKKDQLDDLMVEAIHEQLKARQFNLPPKNQP